MLMGDCLSDFGGAFILNLANVSWKLVLSPMPSVLLGCMWNPVGHQPHVALVWRGCVSSDLIRDQCCRVCQ